MGKRYIIVITNFSIENYPKDKRWYVFGVKLPTMQKGIGVEYSDFVGSAARFKTPKSAHNIAKMISAAFNFKYFDGSGATLLAKDEDIVKVTVEEI